MQPLQLGVWRGCCNPSPLPPPYFLYITSTFDYMKHLFCWQTHSSFSVLNFKLRVWATYALPQMFFFLTLTTAFPTSHHMKTVCSCWVWKLCNDTCPLNLVLGASFLTQSDWLEKKANQLLSLRKEALGARLMPSKTHVKTLHYWQCINAFKSILHF